MSGCKHLPSVVALLILLFVMSGCNLLGGKDRYVNKEHGISFAVPRGWSVNPSYGQEDRTGNSLAAYTQRASEIRVAFFERESVNLMDFVKLQAAFFERFGLRIVAQPKELEIDGRKAIEMAIMGRATDFVENLFGKKLVIPNDQPLVMLSYSIGDENRKRVYQLILSAPQAEYDAAVKDFVEVVNSFQIS